MELDKIIEPERHGMWIATTFIVALLALVMAFYAASRVRGTFYATQTEVLMLNKKIEQLKTDQAKQKASTELPAPVTPAAPAADAPAKR